MPLSAQIALSIVAHETSSGDLSRTLRATPASYSLSLTDGTGASQAQVVWSDSRTISTPGAFDDLNLQSLTDDRGTVNFSAIKALYIRNTSTTDQMLLVGRDWNDAIPATAWVYAPAGVGDQSTGNALRLYRGGVLFLTDSTPGGWTVDQNQRTLRISANDGGTPSYEILLIGEGTVS